jgi:hypothetical protein
MRGFMEWVLDAQKAVGRKLHLLALLAKNATFCGKIAANAYKNTFLA